MVSARGGASAGGALPPVGSRVVVRYLLPSGQATDALGMLLHADAEGLTVDGKRGIEHIARGTVIAAKQVPPPPAPRRARGATAARAGEPEEAGESTLPAGPTRPAEPALPAEPTRPAE